MIEGIASTIANAQASKPVTQVSSGESPAKVEASVSTAPKAPYISPYIALDTSANKAVIQVRDSDTGDVVRQFPSESAIKARQIADAERERAGASKSDQSNAAQTYESTQNTETQSVPASGAQDVNSVTTAQANAPATNGTTDSSVTTDTNVTA